ncbi:MAG: LicD family protein [Prevotella sp.]|nr:LicD family protein [Prevotella sp.]
MDENKLISFDEHKAIQIEILQHVHDFCQSHGIQYTLAYGTLLGAVRHGGYIPWDDDIDIAMLRKDYDRFAEEFNHNAGFYHFYDSRNDKDVNILFGKVADTRTMVIEGGNTKNLGVAIDVFPIDDMCNTYDDSVKYHKSLRLLKVIDVMKCRKVSEVRKLWKKIFFVIVKLLFAWCPLHQLSLKLMTLYKYHHCPDSKYVGWIYEMDKKITERRIWEEYISISFEGRHFVALKDYDTYLKSEYGDYMKLPPEKDRVPQHDFYKMYWI